MYATKFKCKAQKRQVIHIQNSLEGRPTTSGNNNTDLVQLKAQVQEIKTKLGNLTNLTSATPPRNPLFLNVDPADIPTVPSNSAIPTQSDGRIGTTHRRPPIPSAYNPWPDIEIYPYGSHVTVQMAGNPVDCWIQKCIQSD